MSLLNNSVVLIVEDKDYNYLLLDLMVRNLGGKSIWARHGEEAIEKIVSNPNINLVLMDIKMPKMNGIIACSEIRKIRPEIHMIAQTACAMRHEEDEILNSGFDAYLAKPIKMTDFDKVIKDFIHKHPMTA